MNRSTISRDSIRRSGSPGSSNGGATGATGAMGPPGNVLEFDTFADMTAYNFIGTQVGTWIWISDLRWYYTYEPTSTDTVDSPYVVSATGGGRLVAQITSNSYWQQQLTWYIDPANSTGLATDLNDGLTSTTPIRTMRMWRARIKGVKYNASVIINSMSDSTNDDDYNVSGFTTPFGTSTIFVCIRGTVTVLRTSTITSTTAPSGNTPGVIEDTAIPVSWTASGLVSSNSVGIRHIRKQGVNIHSQILQDLGAKTCQIGVPTNISENPAVSPTNVIVNFTNGDTYEVFSCSRWPGIYTEGGGRVRYYLLEFAGSTVSSTVRVLNFDFAQVMLCGFKNFAGGASPLTINYWQSCFCAGGSFVTFAAFTINIISGVFQVTNSGGIFSGINISFIDANLFVSHGSKADLETGIYFWDCSETLITLIYAEIYIPDLINGDGNTNYIVDVISGSYCYGFAETSLPVLTTETSPIRVNGTDYPNTDARPIETSPFGGIVYE